MKRCSEALAAALAAEVTHLATLWRLTRRDGVVMTFTDHDRDIVVDGECYRAGGGFTASSVATAAGLAIDNLEIHSVLDSAVIAEGDLLAGVYDHAGIEIYMVDHADPAAGRLFLRKGRLGEVSIAGDGFVVEVHGMAAPLAASVGQIYAPTCRADLGDERCRVDLVPLTVAGTVAAAEGRRVFHCDGRAEADGWFAHGLLKWTSGANAGMAAEVARFAGDTFELFLPAPRDIAAGDAFTVHAGCDKRFATCREKFANAVDFQGEPHIPGIDFLLEPAGR